MAGEPLEVVKKVKYLGHVIRDDLCDDDDDVQRQCGKLYGQANMLARKFHMCTPDVKISLFKTYCTTLYTAHLWCDFSESKMKKLQVAYNDALRIVLKIPRRSSASEMFVSNNVPTFNAVLRNCMHRFMCRLIGSVEYQGPNQTNLDSIQAWLKHEEPNSTRQQQKVINQTPSPPEYTPTRRRGQRLKFLGSQKL